MTPIRFPWPNLDLSPNGRKDRRWLTSERQFARKLGFYIIKDAKVTFKPDTLLELKEQGIQAPDHWNGIREMDRFN